MTMPQTRHYEMKDSGVEWIGKMPIGWKIVPAKFFMKVQAGYPFDSERFDNSQGIPLIRIRDITSGHTETFYNGDYPEEYVVHNNDLLVGMDGDFNVRWWQGGEAVLNQRCCRIFARNGLLLRYFYFLLPFYLKQVNELAYSTTVKHLANGDIGNADICLPPEDEQTAIAAYLDEKCATIDAIIAEAKASIEEYKSWKASVIFETVTKGLNPYAEMKDSGVEWIGLIPGHWVVKRLKYVAVSLSKGNGITKDETAEDGDTPCVRYGEIYAKYNQSFMECQTRTYKDIITSPKYFTYGDILITCTGELVEEIGKSVAYLGSEKCLAGGDIIVLKHTQNASFLNYALNCNYAQSQKSCDKAKLKVVHISAYDVGNIWMALPPLPEQTAIASYLDSKCAAIDSVIAEKEALISDLETYKRSLIFEVVTGKRRVC